MVFGIMKIQDGIVCVIIYSEQDMFIGEIQKYAARLPCKVLHFASQDCGLLLIEVLREMIASNDHFDAKMVRVCA